MFGTIRGWLAGTLVLATAGTAPMGAAAQTARPVEATTNQGVEFVGTTIRYPEADGEDDRLRTGYVKLQNHRHPGWPSGTGIGWDRYGDYWIAGTIRPAFDDDRARAAHPARGWYQILHGFYSIYVRYVEWDPGLTGRARGYFQFGFYRDFGNSGGFHYVRTPALSEPADPAHPAVPFSAGDRLRYVVQHVATGPERGIAIRVRNLETGVTAAGYAAVYDTSTVFRPVRSIYLGTSSHGHHYDQTGANRTVRDHFVGDIEETMIGQGFLLDEDREAWLAAGVAPGSSGEVLFRQTEMIRRTLVPLLHWTGSPGGCVMTGGDATGAWEGEHTRLRTYPCSRAPEACVRNGACAGGPDAAPGDHYVGLDLEPVVAAEDLRAGVLEFELRVVGDNVRHPGNLEALVFHARLRDGAGREAELRFTPSARMMRREGGRLTVPLESFGPGPWHHYRFDVAALFRRIHPDGAALKLVGVGLTGYASLADIRLVDAAPGDRLPGQD